MLIQVLYKNVLALPCSILSMYFKRSQIHLSSVKHLFSSRYYDSLRSLFHGIPKLLSIFVVIITHTLHTKLAVKSTVSLKIFQLSIYSYMDTHLSKSSRKNFHHSQHLLVWLKFFLAPLRLGPCFFCFAFLTLQQCTVLARNIHQFHITIALTTLNPTCIT